MTQRMVILDAVPSPETLRVMALAISDIPPMRNRDQAQAAHAAMIAASPNGGCVTDAMLERAVAAAEREIDRYPMVLADPMTIRHIRAKWVANAVIAALDLTPASDPPPASDGE